MHPAIDRSPHLAWLVIAAALAVTPALGRAQGTQPETATAEPAAADPANAETAAAVAEEPRSRRERRRAAQAPAEMPVTQVQGAPVAESAVEAEEPEIVCKTIKQLGTKIGQRVCGTPEQWAVSTRRTSDAARDAVQEISSRSVFPAAPEVPAAIP